MPENITSITTRLYFNHPVKEIFWFYRSNDALSNNDYYNYASVANYGTYLETRQEPFKNMHLRYNGNDRFEPLTSTYFRLYQPYRHHSCGTNQDIHVFSFALNPEGIQPSGTSNFSKIDNVSLNCICNPNIQNGYVNIYAINYNILRIQSGMAGLMFSS